MKQSITWISLGILLGVILQSLVMNIIREQQSQIANARYSAVQRYKDQLTTTRQVCLESHKVINGALEQHCGQLQDQTNTEFVCDVMGRCWLEWHGYPSSSSKAPRASYTSL